MFWVRISYGIKMMAKKQKKSSIGKQRSSSINLWVERWHQNQKRRSGLSYRWQNLTGRIGEKTGSFVDIQTDNPVKILISVDSESKLPPHNQYIANHPYFLFILLRERILNLIQFSNSCYNALFGLCRYWSSRTSCKFMWSI